MKVSTKHKLISCVIAATLIALIGYVYRSYIRPARFAKQMNDIYYTYLTERSNLGTGLSVEQEHALCVNLEKQFYLLLDQEPPNEQLSNSNWIERWTNISNVLSDMLPNGKRVYFGTQLERNGNNTYICEWYGNCEIVNVNLLYKLGEERWNKQTSVLIFEDDPFLFGKSIRGQWAATNIVAARVSDSIIIVDGRSINKLTNEYINWGNELIKSNITPEQAFQMINHGKANELLSSYVNLSPVITWAYLYVGYMSISDTTDSNEREQKLANAIFRCLCVHEATHDYIRERNNVYTNSEGENIACASEIANGPLPLHTLRSIQYTPNCEEIMDFIVKQMEFKPTDGAEVTVRVTDEVLKNIATVYLQRKQCDLRLTIEYPESIFNDCYSSIADV